MKPCIKDSPLSPVQVIVQRAQQRLLEMLQEFPPRLGLPQDVYARYLSCQAQLVEGVQRHFFACAAHPEIARARGLRKFVLRFAAEEEPHYAIAAEDLALLGGDDPGAPVAVDVWWAYFDRVVATRPFERLGATCVLESISAPSNSLLHRLIGASPYLKPENTRFLRIHMHEQLPHGEQVFEALKAASPTPAQVADLTRGAEVGAFLYLGMMEWVARRQVPMAT